MKLQLNANLPTIRLIERVDRRFALKYTYILFLITELIFSSFFVILNIIIILD